MTGYTDLGDIDMHFEESRQKDNLPQIAKSMMVFMVRGLFTKVQFPCAGGQFYETSWEAVRIVDSQ